MWPGRQTVYLHAAVDRLTRRQARHVAMREGVTRRQHADHMAPRHQLRAKLLDGALDPAEVRLVVRRHEQDPQPPGRLLAAAIRRPPLDRLPATGLLGYHRIY